MTELRLIEFTENIPSFTGTEGKEYGEFKEGEQAKIPEIQAELLIRRDSAIPVENQGGDA